MEVSREIKDKYIGQKRSTIDYGDYKIIDVVKIKRKDGRIVNKFKVQFEEYFEVKYEKIVDLKELNNGHIKNPFYPKIYGVGCIGELEKKVNVRTYAIWNQMMARCYNKEHKSYKTYGAQGVTVCERWHNYSNFYKDYDNMGGHSRTKRMDMDKDVLQSGIDNKVYSPETCRLITPTENGREVAERTRQRYFLALSPNEKFYVDNNVSKFSSKYSTHIDRLDKVKILGYTVSNNGWRFRYMTDLEVENYLNKKIIPIDYKMLKGQNTPQAKLFIGKNTSTNEEIVSYNKSKFNEIYGNHKSCIAGCLNKRYHRCRDRDGNWWKFRYLTDYELNKYLSQEYFEINFDKPQKEEPKL